MLLELFEKFLKEKQFLANISPKTVRSYKQAFNAYRRVVSKCELPRCNLLLGDVCHSPC
jgi:hypothetical protein